MIEFSQKSLSAQGNTPNAMISMAMIPNLS